MKLLTLARDLQRRKARERHQQFVAEGVRTVESLLASPCPVDGVLVAEDARDDVRVAALIDLAEGRGIAVRTVTAREFESAADTDAPQGVLAVAHMPEAALTPPTGPSARYLVLDALQDPGNVGTVVRTAAALGVTATIALPGTVDVWNAKVVRSAMGALFTHTVVATDWDRCQAFLAEQGAPCWAADMDGQSIDALDRAALPARLALVVSNEGAGLSPHIEAAVAARVAIPMAPGIESLNVAVATGILLQALRPVRLPATGAVPVA
ncbi:MAG: RNA methyltransferase [Gemmatimonadaceae bacterium]|nr:RNA methyltransferase [Gemmatimonadaceae bacterium]